MEDIHQNGQTGKVAGTMQEPYIPAGQTPESLREAIRATREQVACAIAEADHVRLQEIPAIKAEYAVRVGCWETQLLQAELACRKAKRRLQLLRSQANQGASPNVQAVDQQVEAELEEWSGKVAQALQRQAAALSYATGMVPLSPTEAKRVRKLYHVLARRLHPDLHPGQAEQFEDLFQIVRGAYEMGNVDVLQSLEVSTRCYEREGDGLEGLSAEELACALELTQVELAMRREELAKLRESPIFQVDRNLKDPDWLARTVGGLRASIKEFDQARAGYEARIKQLLEAQ